MASQIGRKLRNFFIGKHAAQGKYLHRLIWISCISICIPILLAGIIYYQFSMDRVRQQFLDENKSTLVMMKDRAERIMQNIEQESLQLSLDPRINDFFAGRMEDAPLIWHQQLLQEITLVKNANSFIDEIYFYNNEEDLLLTNRYGAIDKDSYKHKDEIDQLMKLASGSQWLFLPAGKKEGYITFARKLPVVGSGKSGVLVFEIETSLISSFLQADTTILTKGSEMVLISYPDLFKLDAKEKGGFMKRLENLEGLQTLRTADSTIGSFYETGPDGRPAQFTYVKSMFGRTYVTVTPEQMLAGRIQWIRVVTFSAVLFFILLGILLTYFNTKRVYSPIGKLIQHSRQLGEGRIQSKADEFAYISACLDFLSSEAEKLGGYMEKVQPTLRERCLQQLVNGEYVRSELLIQECESFGIDIHSTYCVIVVEVENAFKEQRFFPKDKPIVAFAVSNVMQELLQKNELLSGYIFANHGKGVALLQWDNDAGPVRLSQAVRSFAESVNESLMSYLSFKAAIGIGRSYSHIADVPVSFREAELALQYRIYEEAEPVMYIEDLENRSGKQASFRYPREQENSIVDALAKGELEQARQSLVQFTESIRPSQSYNFIYQSYHVLLSAIITSLEKQGGSILDLLEYNLFGQLETKQTSREIFDWFNDNLFPLYHKLTEEYRSSAGQSAVLQISKYIREHSTEDLSLVQCAEMIGMSPSYLSRLFKKEMGVNFLEFVVECKVEEAKRLLLETDMNVSDIAAAIGYSERNLNRIFQRHTRMNPSIFRAEHR
ncbi:helix-turn-helix domain-containing protein [Paenibacillus piri]|uniref:AraC family transcriptional regulator n=1 Tax=Paenibacillus piri TaxID=2547395 RepID=A0A4R5KX99_9BACL|nr:helix-turn-helix domain-containing protein [Paenibacillus piri]TDG00680.1 AraC family transcriptional regulator [Paenibacillus piri]